MSRSASAGRLFVLGAVYCQQEVSIMNTQKNEEVILSPQRRLWSVEEFERAGELGLFGPEERLELIEQHIISKVTPQSPPHACRGRSTSHWNCRAALLGASTRPHGQASIRLRRGRYDGWQLALFHVDQNTCRQFADVWATPCFSEPKHATSGRLSEAGGGRARAGGAAGAARGAGAGAASRT